MNPDDLARILDELGQRLGPTGEYVFALAVRQVVIDGVLALVGLATVTLLAVGVIGYSLRRLKEDEGWGIVVAFVPVFWVMFAVPLLIIASSNLLNPEYAALRGILGAIR